MDNYSPELDVVFGALSDPTRRQTIATLCRTPMSVADLGKSSSMTLPAFMKHIRVLERSDLIRTQKVGRVRTCVLNRERLAVADEWLREQQAIWEGRTDRLERFLSGEEEL
jgi:DNA-binding transcriptional ArsR family regulator